MTKHKKLYTRNMFEKEMLSPEEEYFVKLMVENPTQSHTHAARIAFPECPEPCQKGWQILQKPKVMNRWLESMKIWNRVLSVPRLLKNLEESLNAMKLILKSDGTEIEWPDHAARNKAREQAFEILGILERANILEVDQSTHKHLHVTVFRNPEALKEESNAVETVRA